MRGFLKSLQITLDGHKSLCIETTDDIRSIYDELHDVECDIEIKKHREKRSLDANALCWVLCGKIAQKMKIKSSEEVYKRYVRETGAYTIVPIREDAIDKWNEIWNNKGIGWITEDIGECRNTKGYHNIKCFYGSSCYDTEEMSHLLEIIIADCKELGIETMTPEEEAQLMASWEAKAVI